jgi:hypothetical protein
VTSAKRLSKCSRVMSVEGCEIIGPSYSAPACMHGQRQPQHVTTSREGLTGYKVVREENSNLEGRNPTRGGEGTGDGPDKRITGQVRMTVGRKPAPRWCPSGTSRTQRRRLQKMRR